MRDSQRLVIPTGAESVQYVDHYALARRYGKHLTEMFSASVLGNGAASIGLVTQRSADIPAPGTLDIVSDDADDDQDVTIYGLDGSGDPLVETLTLDGTTPVEGVEEFATVLGASLSGAAEGTVIIRDTVLPTTVFSFATTVLRRGIAVVDVEVTGAAFVSVDTNAAVDMLVVGEDADGNPLYEAVDLTAGTTPIELTEAFAVITALVLGDVAAARTVSLSAGDTVIEDIPFEPAIVEAIRVGAATRMLPGPSGAVNVDMLTGDAAADDLTVAAGDSGYTITLPRSLALPGVRAYVQCFGYQDILGSS